MGYDLYTWSPSITTGGGTPDDRNIPGGTKLDGTKDNANNPVVVIPGDSSGFPALPVGNPVNSDVPTVAQINASSHWNQVIAAYNRRAMRAWIDFGITGSLGATTPNAPFAYFAQGNLRINAVLVQNLRIAINQIRQAEGFPNYTFSALRNQGFGGAGINATPILGRHLAECRDALRIAGTKTLQPINLSWAKYQGFQTGQYTRVDSPYGTPVSENVVAQDYDSIAGPNTANEVGKTWSGAVSNQMKREREYFQFPIPDYVSSAPAASITTSLNYFLGIEHTTNTETFNGKWYSSNTDDSARSMGTFNGFMYNTNNLLGSWLSSAATGANFTFTIAQTLVQPLSGGRFCMIVGTDNELTNGGLSTFASATISGTNVWNGFPAGSEPTWTQNFGV